eukprot:scaffold291310_cov31-Tisochrysis_lutea.AAC.9
MARRLLNRFKDGFERDSAPRVACSPRSVAQLGSVRRARLLHEVLEKGRDGRQRAKKAPPRNRGHRNHGRRATLLRGDEPETAGFHARVDVSTGCHADLRPWSPLHADGRDCVRTAQRRKPIETRVGRTIIRLAGAAEQGCN